MSRRLFSADLSCPQCQHRGSEVTNTNGTKHGGYIRRRRECMACRFRWTTREVHEDEAISKAAVAARLQKMETTLSYIQDDLNQL